MTPVETLRSAARLMRERAEAATPGPWEASRSDVWTVDRIGDDDDDDGDEIGVIDQAPDAMYIAGMHPSVALAVADWLNDETACYGLGVRRGLACPLAVARAYLGGDE